MEAGVEYRSLPSPIPSLHTLRRSGTQFSIRALVAGLFVGVLVNISNTYYGLQAGIYFQMPMISGLLGYLLFKGSERLSIVPLSPGENVLIISAATATGCMPVAAHFGGIIPALEFVIGPQDGGPYHFSFGQLLIWAFSLAFFGIFFAAILHNGLIQRDRSPWPGAKATAQMLTVMHETTKHGDNEVIANPTGQDQYRNVSGAPNRQWQKVVSVLLRFGGGSFLLTTATHFLPSLRTIPIFGMRAAQNWLWDFDLSAGFIGGGIITGPVIPLHMLCGTIVGWAILSPLIMSKGWVHGPVDDWETGSRSWIIWISTSALVADAAVNLLWFVLESLRKHILDSPVEDRPDDSQTPLLHNSSRDAPRRRQREHLPATLLYGFKRQTRLLLVAMFVLSIIICVIGVRLVFGSIIGPHLVVLGIALALPMAVAGIRALAECDWNPQNGLVSQLVFATLVSRANPNALVINLVTAGIASACASQSGDIAFDFKLGSFLDANPDAQIYGHIAGSIFGTFVATVSYRLYTSSYEVPGPVFQIPGSYISVSTARLILGKGLPEGVPMFALAFGGWFAISAFLKLRFSDRWWNNVLPSGTAFAIGMANVPSFTLSRLVGGIACWAYSRWNARSGNITIASGAGMILGETIGSIADLCLTAVGV
ncbi:OPT superfamily oligopeptide transporter [Pseudovirgaria hyperparasitica]|uniref:OPT superfamily oligopeptide transporter n=1 Tax=Pseudovirgaria hyperparasitica TaxID=470096 RepID=A0A6A6VS96_9PEZI|nr:OPT superfamily oligopeptide transporter [Pseudovirgaria hyperparasitica]KAF2753093.1 OPT superfamily oligopeptide transporter [Pseudovirgaria hyperparasitica]